MKHLVIALSAGLFLMLSEATYQEQQAQEQQSEQVAQ